MGGANRSVKWCQMISPWAEKPLITKAAAYFLPAEVYFSFSLFCFLITYVYLQTNQVPLCMEHNNSCFIACNFVISHLVQWPCQMDSKSVHYYVTKKGKNSVPLAQGSQKYRMSFCFDFADANCLLFNALLRPGCLLFIDGGVMSVSMVRAEPNKSDSTLSTGTLSV